jgi:hypothetical protein
MVPGEQAADGSELDPELPAWLNKTPIANMQDYAPGLLYELIYEAWAFAEPRSFMAPYDTHYNALRGDTVALATMHSFYINLITARLRRQTRRTLI